MQTCFHSQLALKILNGGTYCCSGLLSLCVPIKIAIFSKNCMLVITLAFTFNSHIFWYLFNKRGGWHKRGGGAKVAKLLNVEVGINVEGWIFWKKLVHNSNKQGVEGGKI